MKGMTDEPQYSVGLLEGGTALCDVIDSHIYEQTLVRALQKHGIFLTVLLETRYCSIMHRVLDVVGCHLTDPHYVVFLPQADKNAFFVADLGIIMRQHIRWRTHMPQMRPYYAVRCNSSAAVIEVLAALGTGFICTNKVLAKHPGKLLYLRCSPSLYQGRQCM